jgi:hypothetical protein
MDLRHLRKKKTLVTVIIIFVVILYLNHDDNAIKPQELYSEKTNEASKESNKSLSKPQLLLKEPVSRAKVKKNEDLDFLACLPDFFSDEEVLRKDIDQYLQSLENSFSEAEPLYYALYAPPPEGESKLDLLFDYYNHLPSSPILSMDLISSCVNSQDKRCSIDFVTNAIASDSKNAAIWVSAISFYAAKGDDSKVLGTIAALEKTSFFNERYGEKALLYAQALEGSSSNNFLMNAIAGIGKAASSFPPYSPITQWCKQHLDEASKANACLTLGEQLETRSKTLMSKAIGVALQEIVFKSQGNIEAIQLIEQKRKELMPSSENDAYQKASMMLMLDERLFRSWLNNVDFYGEVESQQLLVEEAKLLNDRGNNYLCSLVYDIVDSL